MILTGIKAGVIVFDGLHVAIMMSKAMFLLFDVILVATGCILDCLDVIGRSGNFF